MLFLASIECTKRGLVPQNLLAALLNSWRQYLSESRGEQQQQKQFARSEPSSLAIKPKMSDLLGQLLSAVIYVV